MPQRQQDVAPHCEGLVYEEPQRYLRVEALGRRRSEEEVEIACRYAGIDWASDKHDVLEADQNGMEVLTATYAHDEKGLTALCRALVRLEVALVAIERPDGLLVERLLDAGLRVLPLHPNKVAAARDRFRVSGGKSREGISLIQRQLGHADLAITSPAVSTTPRSSRLCISVLSR